jgi:Transposase, Mutator family
MGDDTPAALGALRVDEGKLKDHVSEVVRSSVEETLNGLLDAEADQICRAQRYERSPERVDGRAGHYERKLETKAEDVTLRVPKLRRLPFETASVGNSRRRPAHRLRSRNSSSRRWFVGRAHARRDTSLIACAESEISPTTSEARLASMSRGH